ncbi:tyrosine-type recombinase/integrase [Pontibacter qinzhouensis]|uniref:Tyrosine-type recombinase/integrase n=1 Tax=Pontibacter qinzhouensis TaxID=2603253 RepID=A0A5C8K7R5_9BACT|nr:site-specific integrase [Pontibacter qinzhouensis]TXK45364.1 tyrosine-type recombinase/integrase [Pontibacter qinzhouensis]
MIPVLTSVMLDTRRTLKDGSFPVRLRLTYQRQRKYYNTSYSLSETEFSKVQAEKPKGKYKELQIAFQAIEQKALSIIRNLDVFTFEQFEKKYLKTAVKNDVFTAFEQQVKNLAEEGRVGTASSYESASLSLLSYIHKQPLNRNKGLTRAKANEKKENLLKKRKPLAYAAITVDFLMGYEKWMLLHGNSITTIGIYLRAVRAIYNNAIAAGEVTVDLYPFGKRKYQIPSGRNVKKALTLADIEKIFSYQPASENEGRARDLWVFSYLCNGINVKDIARLKYKQLDKDTITFVRAKTERTSRQNLKAITAMRTPEIDEIIERWGNKPAYSEAYVFPLLEPELSAKKELAKVQHATKTINKYIKRVAAAVGIEKNVSTYTARHSFSTVLKRAGAPIELISESLGHSNLRTTESYLDSFEDDVKRQYTAQLTAFKNASLGKLS